mgnify:CR=1 FL=1
MGVTGAVDDDAKDDEADHRNDFNEGEKELGFAIAFDAKEVYRDNENEKDRDEDGAWERVIPVTDSYASGDDFERENDEPLRCIAFVVSNLYPNKSTDTELTPSPWQIPMPDQETSSNTQRKSQLLDIRRPSHLEHALYKIACPR